LFSNRKPGRIDRSVDEDEENLEILTQN